MADSLPLTSPLAATPAAQTRATCSPARFRDVLGRFATGVAVITALSDGRPVGVACSSFTSASLEPPLVAFFVGKSSSTWPHLRHAGHFIANVLASDQADLCRTFARKNTDRFSGVGWMPGQTGAPRIDGAIAWIECDLCDISEAGDHWLVLGAVRDLDAVPSSGPLVFFGGGFHRLAA